MLAIIRPRLSRLSLLATLLLAGCGTTFFAQATATVDQVLTDVQSVCSAVIDDSTGAVATLIKSFPVGTTALAIADSVCAYIVQIQPIPQSTVTTPAASARLVARSHARAALSVPLQSVTVNGVTLGFARVAK